MLRTTLLFYTGSRLLLAFADKQILNPCFDWKKTGFFSKTHRLDYRRAFNVTGSFISSRWSTTPLSRVRYPLPHWLVPVREAIEFSEGIQFGYDSPVASKGRAERSLITTCVKPWRWTSVSPSQQCLLEFSTHILRNWICSQGDRGDNHYLAGLSIESIDPVGT